MTKRRFKSWLKPAVALTVLGLIREASFQAYVGALPGIVIGILLVVVVSVVWTHRLEPGNAREG